MASEYSQSTYFQPSQDTLKARSGRKKVYKYTEEQFTTNAPVIEKHKLQESKYNINDFSFEDRSKRIYTPKRDVETLNEIEISPIVTKNNSKKKDFDSKINKIDNLNNKIHSFLKMVDTNQNKKINQNKISSQQTKQDKIQFTPRSQYERPTTYLSPSYTPYEKIEEAMKRPLRTDERKKNYSYLQQIEDSKNQQVQNEDKPTNPYFEQNYKVTERASSPISKYKQQSQQLKVQIPQKTVINNQKSKQQPISNVLKSHNRLEKRSQLGYKYLKQQSLIDNYRQQKQKIVQIQKQNDNFQKMQKYRLNNTKLDIQISELKNKILCDSPIKYQKDNQSYFDIKSNQIRRQNYIIQQEQQSHPNLQQLAIKLSYIIDLDIILRRIRNSFEQYKNDKKWQLLKAELKSKNIYIEQKQLKQIIKISIHERNPFGQKIQIFPLNGIKDLSKLFSQIDRIWRQQLDKFILLDELAKQNFEMSFIDLNRKGFINIQDLVCFINVHAQKFYRTRDLAQLFRRFLELQNKNLDKNINDGISYKTFMNKLCR